MPRSSLLGVALDSGTPHGSADYTTVVILHGFVWHGETASLGKQHNSRIIVLNRRDYPGSTPYSDEERAALARLVAASPGPEETQQQALAFMRDREAKTGGIILVGWSFAVVWMLAFLAHTETFPTGDVDLGEYVRRVVLYDGAMGHAPPPNHYHPLSDTTLPAEERLQRWHR
ncbi:hypothetical protein C8Q80DRAFT_1222720 [Daedaleopsis nitida]|nr:hypothetical protein C8Q80DRAFT_1222720 [Daedaleopsis nitida]